SGSVAFFEAQKASGVATFFKGNSAYQAVTSMGAAGDSTSIDNMLAALNYIDYCNGVRKKLGLKELTVTHQLMAEAQGRLNQSLTHDKGHAKKTSGETWVGENLAWGSSSPKGAYEGWYTAEKATFDEAVKSGNYPDLATWGDYKSSSFDANKIASTYPDLYPQIGHYLNVVNPNATTTGFAVNTTSGAEFGIALGQTFGTGKGTSVADYEKALKAYCDTSSAQKKLDDANAALASAQADAQAKADAISAAQEAIPQAEGALAAAKDARPAAEQALSDAQAGLADPQAAVDAAQAKANAAQANVDAAQAEVDAAQNAVDEKQAAVDTAKDSVTAAEDAASAATSTTNDAQAAVKNAQDAYDALTDPKSTEVLRQAVEQAKAALEEAKNAQAAATQAQQEAKSTAEVAETALTDAQAALDKATATEAAAQSARDAAQAKADSAAAEYDDLKALANAATDAKAALDVAQKAADDAAAAKAAADKVLATAKDDAAYAQAASDDAQAYLKQAQTYVADTCLAQGYVEKDAPQTALTTQSVEAATDRAKADAAALNPYFEKALAAQADADAAEKARATESAKRSAVVDDYNASVRTYNAALKDYQAAKALYDAAASHTTDPKSGTKTANNTLKEDGRKRLPQTGDSLVTAAPVAGTGLFALLAGLFARKKHRQDTQS
ncbi:MAG: LPXTG cell wall anchor domain-containing protein, partial [Atopobiaceae bacterium]|nr:LPXTG cell wall anchor domain-containing protein [Atopobiaceae bacterium]